MKSANSSTSADAEGHDLVVISSSSGTAETSTKFRDVTKPVIIMRYALFDEMGMVSTDANQAGGGIISDVLIQSPGHYLTAGLSGAVTTYSIADNANWGVPAASAIRVASHTSDATRQHIFAYESGAAMVGMNAPARRLAFMFRDNGVTNTNANGAALLQAAINWSLGLDGTSPVITAQPSNQSVTEGQVATFTVSASGVPAPSYQWRRNGANVSGATSMSYTIPSVLLADDGAEFSVVVTNSQGSVTSAGATLSVNAVPASPAITTQPSNQSVTEGQAVTFTVAVTGVPAPTYQWRRNGVNISGATSASYSLISASQSDNGSAFSVAVTNSQGVVISEGAVLTVHLAPEVPAITTQPTNQSVVEGQSASFAIEATGVPAPTIQWRRNGTDISGATQATYSLAPTVIADDGAVFSAVVTNTQGVVTSSNATLTVNPAPASPTITAQPLSLTVSEGQAASFTVVATGIPAPVYQWRRNGVDIPGGSSPSFSIPSASMLDDGAAYRVVVSNSEGLIESDIAILSVNQATVVPIITLQPSDQTVYLGAPASFMIAASGFPEPTFQWRRNGESIPGATSTSYSIPSTLLSDDGAVFSVVVTNTQGTATSSGAHLHVNIAPAAPAISAHPGSVNVAEGQSASFSVIASGHPSPSYQWRRNGVAISGATSASYATPPLVQADDGATFTVVVMNEHGTAISSEATLSVGSIPTSRMVSLTAEIFDNDGNPIGSSTPVNLDATVNFFTSPMGGAPVYSESFLASNGQAVAVSKGILIIRLGAGLANTDLQHIVSQNSSLYAEFVIGPPGEQEAIQPRTPVTAPLFSGTSRFLQGTGDPLSSEPVGTYYLDTVSGRVWLRSPLSWVKITP